MKKTKILMKVLLVLCTVIIGASQIYFLCNFMGFNYLQSGIIALSICSMFWASITKISYNHESIVSGYKSSLQNKLFEDINENKTANNKDILQLMIENMGEIKEYYLISKNHIQLAFWLAFCSCIFGFILLSFGLYIAFYTKNTEPAIVTIIGGTITELVAGTSLLIHKSSVDQLKFYYQALHENEQFLSIINLVSKVSQGKQDDMYEEIIKGALEKYKNKE